MNLRSLSAALSLAISLSAAQAGGFGGPPPFRNNSPLLTGNDGIYQAVASATNLTGIFTFAIQGGVQTTNPNQNNWVFFVDGDIMQGSTNVNISGGKVNGILDAGISSLPTDSDGQLTLPISILIPGNAASGTFYGKIDENSPVAAFNGKGSLVGTPGRVDQILLVTGDEGTSFVGFLPGVGFIDITGAIYIPIAIPASTQPEVDFKFRGTRLTTSVTTSGTTSGTSSGG